MSRNNVASEVSARATGFVANHPRLVVTMTLLVLLVAAQGSVAAASEFADHVSAAAERVDVGAGEAMAAGEDVSGAVDEISTGATERSHAPGRQPTEGHEP